MGNLSNGEKSDLLYQSNFHVPSKADANAAFWSMVVVVVVVPFFTLSGLSGIRFSMACKMIASDNFLDMAWSNASRCSELAMEITEEEVAIGLSTTLAEAVEGMAGSSMANEFAIMLRMRDRREAVVDLSLTASSSPSTTTSLMIVAPMSTTTRWSPPPK